jgi:DNA-binding response OmpR family regulator
MRNKRVPRILLVESEPKWSQAVESTLEKHGKYDVERVTSIEAALDTSYANGFDLILINAALALGKDVSKFEEIVHLYPDKVLVISDVSSISTAIKVFKIGADYADKPFDPSRVMDLVASRLQKAYEATSQHQMTRRGGQT